MATVTRRQIRRTARMNRRLRRGALSVTSVIATAGLVAAGLIGGATAAVAATDSYTVPGSYTTTVPAGACFVTATVLGAGGSDFMMDGTAENRNGAGARVTATFPVTPGQAVAVTVASGGTTGAAGSPGGGAPGIAVIRHGGGAGGGYSELIIAGQSLIVAGGGGGTGGGHAISLYSTPFSNVGHGGNAGLPSSVGIFAGSTGGLGVDFAYVGSPPVGEVFRVGGGTGGSTVPGVGGLSNPLSGGEDGAPGSGRNGGHGGNDTGLDAGGGAGGGYQGGGGGASTNGESVAGGGGGGGSSFVASSAVGAVSSSVGPVASHPPVTEDAAYPGEPGMASLVWDTDSCATATDDQKINQPAGPISVAVRGNDDGSYQPGSLRLLSGTTPVTTLLVAGQGTWTISGENVVFTPLSTFLGNPTPIRYQWSTPGGSTVNAQVTVGYKPVANDDVKLNNPLGTAVSVPLLGNDVGALNAASTRLLNGATPVTSLPVAGEGTWTVSGGTVVFTPLPTFTGDPTPVNYRITDVYGVTDDAKVTVTYLPVARPDVDSGNDPGDPVTVDVLANDHDGLDRLTVKLLDPEGDPVAALTVPGEGVWTVNPVSGAVTFTPEPDFEGNPTPVTYQANNPSGNPVTSTVTVAYLPQALDDEKLLQPFGMPVTVAPLGNDIGDLVPSSVRLIDAGGAPVSTLVVPTEGTWTANPDGTLTFTPEPGFLADPSPVKYRATDVYGDTTYELDGTDATVTVTYLPEAIDDVSHGNTAGDPVVVDAAVNDHHALVPATMRLLDGATPVTELQVPGEGTWKVSSTGKVTFTPEPGFEGNPTPIDYVVETAAGAEARAKVTVAYLPAARDDKDLNNVFGTAVDVDILPNDIGDLDPATVRLVGTASAGLPLVVPNEGTWSVNPATGVVTFTPLPSFNGNPTPIDYTVNDLWGHPTGADITVTYVPDARDDVSAGNTPGTPVTVGAVDNDFETLVPSTLRLLKGNTPVTTLVVVGEGTWTVDVATGEVTFTPDTSFTGNPTPVNYVIEDPAGTSVTAKVTVAYLPVAVDDEKLNNTFGEPVTLQIIGNDSEDLNLASVQLAGTANPGDDLVVPNEGTWMVGADGTVTFTPLPTFTGNPTPVGYTVDDIYGFGASATVRVTYRPDARDDEDLDNVLGTSVTLDVTANDHDSIVPSTVRLVDGNGDPATTLVVAGEGTWSVDSAGLVTFTPEAGFLLDPTPIEYRAEDADGAEVTATITVTYLPQAVADEKLDNPFGEAVLVADVLGNDTGIFDRSSVRLLDAAGDPVTELVVPGEGTWLVRGDAGIRFTPEAGFTGDPTPVEYQVTDVTGDVVTASVTVTYLPTAVDDFGVGEEGDPVIVDVVGNDHDALDPTTVKLLDGNGDPVTTLVVPGEGTWTVNPTTGQVTFTPEPGFVGNPTPVDYQIDGPTGPPVTATITVVYGPLAMDDRSYDNTFGSPVEVDVIGNDLGDLDPSSVTLLDANGNPVSTLLVPGEGTWTVNPTTGTITFTPLASFIGDPTPVEYRVTDRDGKTTTATVTVTYLPTAVDDISLGNTPGKAVTVDVIGNDHDSLDPSTVALLDANGNPVATLLVPGEGTWKVNPDGTITFTPLAGFTGDPTPVLYQVQTVDGDTVTAQVTVGFAYPALAFTGFSGGWATILGLLLLCAGAIVLSGRKLRGSRKLLSR